MGLGLGNVPYHFQISLFTSETGVIVTTRIVVRIKSNICKEPSTMPHAWWVVHNCVIVLLTPKLSELSLEQQCFSHRNENDGKKRKKKKRTETNKSSIVAFPPGSKAFIFDYFSQFPIPFSFLSIKYFPIVVITLYI